jgi:putative PIN family toxin of toxin-antitoxin system
VFRGSISRCGLTDAGSVEQARAVRLACVGYRMEYHGQREPLKRRDVRHTGGPAAVDSVAGIVYDTAMVPRVVIDTSVFISALRSRRGASYRLLMLIGGKQFEIALSVPLVVEYEDAAKRMPDATGLEPGEVDDVIDYLCSVAHLQEIHFLWRPALRDARDDHVLELAVEAGCRIIVTHNMKDFVEAERFGIEAVTPGEFLGRIGGQS